MSDIVFSGWSDIWRNGPRYASVRFPDIRPPPQTISLLAPDLRSITLDSHLTTYIPQAVNNGGTCSLFQVFPETPDTRTPDFSPEVKSGFAIGRSNRIEIRFGSGPGQPKFSDGSAAFFNSIFDLEPGHCPIPSNRTEIRLLNLSNIQLFLHYFTPERLEFLMSSNLKKKKKSKVTKT